MLFASKKEEIESAIVREAFKQHWEGFTYDFPQLDGAEEDWAKVVFTWPIPRNGAPCTFIFVRVAPASFDAVNYEMVRGYVAEAMFSAQHHGFDPTNPNSVRRVDRNLLN